MIEVSQKAQDKLGEYLKLNSLDSPIRVYLAQGGCSGPALALALDESKDNDDSFEAGGLTYLIDKELSALVGAVKVDYLDQGYQSGFTVSSENPVGSPSSCESGCCGSCSC